MFALLLPICILCSQIILLTQLRYTAWPEMLAYPYLLEKGFHFYHDIFHPYLPLLPYTIFLAGRVIGLSVFSIQVVTYLLIFLNGVLFWQIASHWFAGKIPIVLLGLYIVLSTLFDVNGLWFDLAVVPLILTAFLFFIKDQQLKKPLTIFIVGILLGMAFVTKQTSLFFVVSLTGHLITSKNARNAMLLLMSALVPCLCLLFFFNVVDLWQWGIVFPIFAISNLPGYTLFPSLRQLLVLTVVFIPLISIIRISDKKIKYVFLWLLPSILFLLPRFDYFHLQPLLPFFVLYVGVLITKMKRTHISYAVFGVYFVILTSLFCRYAIKYFGQPVRFFEPSVITTSNKLSQTLAKDEPVLFYNTTANYFVAANLLPAKPWADNFPWYMELAGVQDEIIKSLEEAPVRHIIFTQPTHEGVWTLGTYIPAKLDTYIKNNYIKQIEIEKNIFLYTKI